MHELLHKCGGIVFADVWGDIHICNCVRMQAPTVPSADGGTYAELQEQHKTQEVNLKAANDTLERQRADLEAAEKTRQELQAKFKTLEKERDTWKQSCIQRTEELKALKEDYKNLQAINEVCGE